MLGDTDGKYCEYCGDAISETDGCCYLCYRQPEVTEIKYDIHTGRRLMDKKSVHIFAGGTRFYIAPHLALSAPAEGNTGFLLETICKRVFDTMDVKLHLTRQARAHRTLADDPPLLDTNADVSEAIDELLESDRTKIIFFPISMVDHKVLPLEVKSGMWTEIGDGSRDNPLHPERLDSRKGHKLDLSMSDKVIDKIRDKRKDIFLCGFKQTTGKTADEQYLAGLNLCKKASCNLVLANDTETKLNMVICPEEARYHVTTNREEAIRGLVEMAKLRSHLTFTRSTVIAGVEVDWSNEKVPASLRTIVDHCIGRNAYRPFNGTTAGHFAVKLDDTNFLTSRRRTNFQDLHKIGLVHIKTDGPDTVVAYGSKPSVGGQSQRIVFKDHPDCDCIVHFHCPIKEGSDVKQVSQYEFECGSHECGKNTSDGLRKHGNLYAVYLKEHGPNVVFNKDIDPQEVISFIEQNFDLDQKTGGFVSTDRV